MPDRVEWEPFGVAADVRAALEKRGHAFARKPDEIGDAQGILVDLKTGVRYGAADPRGGGAVSHEP